MGAHLKTFSLANGESTLLKDDDVKQLQEIKHI